MSGEEVYEEVLEDSSDFESTIFSSVNKIRTRDDLPADTLEYIFNKDSIFARFYFLPKIHKRLHNVLCRVAISNCGYHPKKYFFI